MFDIIYKIRQQMDTDYNTLEKQLDELEASQETLIDKYKADLQAIIDVKDFTDIDSVSKELKARLTLLKENKQKKV